MAARSTDRQAGEETKTETVGSSYSVGCLPVLAPGDFSSGDESDSVESEETPSVKPLSNRLQELIDSYETAPADASAGLPRPRLPTSASMTRETAAANVMRLTKLFRPERSKRSRKKSKKQADALRAKFVSAPGGSCTMTVVPESASVTELSAHHLQTRQVGPASWRQAFSEAGSDAGGGIGSDAGSDVGSDAGGGIGSDAGGGICSDAVSVVPLRVPAPTKLPTTRAATPATIIFDWDDTLFPTWYMQEKVVPHEPSMSSSSHGDSLPSSSPFFETLNQHSLVIEQTLRTARRFGEVAIVTLGRNPWVTTSSAKWLPNFKLEALLKELHIPVVYARDCVKTRHIVCAEKYEDESVNLFTVAKKLAMMKVIKKHSKRSPFTGNLISIGDSKIERDAAKEFLWEITEDLTEITPLCKTVKFMEEPSLDELGVELHFIQDWIENLVLQPEDFDIRMDDNAEESLKRFRGAE